MWLTPDFHHIPRGFVAERHARSSGRPRFSSIGRARDFHVARVGNAVSALSTPQILQHVSDFRQAGVAHSAPQQRVESVNGRRKARSPARADQVPNLVLQPLKWVQRIQRAGLPCLHFFRHSVRHR